MKDREWSCRISADRYMRLTSIIPFAPLPSVNEQPSQLPPTWHWLHTHETPIGAPLGEDGHADRPDGVPPEFSQRLWAGSDIQIRKPAFAGTEARFQLTVEPAIIKNGRSGDFVLVPVNLAVFDSEGCILTERRTGAYRRPNAKSYARSGTARESFIDPRIPPSASRTVELDEVTLFRYSALLGVAHRIHYDQPYATDIEHYPGLVVHGPLLAQMLTFHAQALMATSAVRSIKIRAKRPVFLGESIVIHTATYEEGRRFVSWAEARDGRLSMSVELSAG